MSAPVRSRSDSMTRVIAEQRERQHERECEHECERENVREREREREHASGYP